MSGHLEIMFDWQADETLYSWSARMHRLLGTSVRDTGQMLFGISHAYKEWGASSRLHHLSTVSRGRLGTVHNILLQRTVLAAYYPFLRGDQQDRFVQLTRGSDNTMWLTRFGIRASAIEGPEMRWCQHCVSNDRDQLGVPHWRLQHQLPGAWWCVEHNMPLFKLTQARFEWPLPGNSGDQPSAASSANEVTALYALSKLAASLIGTEHLQLGAMKRALLSRLRDLDVVLGIKPVSASRLQHWFASTNIAQASRNIEPRMHKVLDREWIYEVLLKRRANHPLLWMILWVAAFEGQPLEETIKGFHEPEIFATCDENGQGSLWVERDFRGDEKVQTIVRNAETIEDAARQLKVSVFTIRRYMREAQCAPRHVRQTEFRQRKLESAIVEIRNLLLSRPDATKSDVHRLCKGAVSLLRRWEPSTLSSLLARFTEVRDRQTSFDF